jgi:hypothetical protein
VYDWVVFSILSNESMIRAGESQEAANLAIDVVLRTLYAVKFGAISGRITGDQETSTVTLYTNIWE